MTHPTPDPLPREAEEKAVEATVANAIAGVAAKMAIGITESTLFWMAREALTAAQPMRAGREEIARALLRHRGDEIFSDERMWKSVRGTVALAEADAILAFPPLQQGSVGERDAKDFAIEFGGYLADSVEAFMEFLNVNGIAVGKPATDQEAMTDHWRGVQSAIYEFKKRRDRAASPSVPQQEGWRTIESEVERLREAVLQWSTLAMRAQPSITSEAWLRDCRTVRENPAYAILPAAPPASHGGENKGG